ncbi:MAG: sensor histidine kinase [Ancrocorticia sp.]|uniref:sensor histidine kinase n=1 Tax=Ancrocorticia sp. TaxID=2593684 RepID=UPI003F90A8E2
MRARRRQAQLAARVDMLDRQPAVVSHEIRTPLALVRGAAELLAEETPGPLTPIQATFVTTIADNTQLVIDMAENMLTAAKFESGGIQTRMELVDIRAVVSGCAREVRRILGTPIRVEASGGLIPIVTDENQVRQMVWNLVNNAARHAGPDSAITISVRASSEGGCTISVIDDGSGMTDTDLEALFAPFSTGSTRRPGSGLGMMVVKRIAVSLGGRVMVDTDVGRGTAIVVQLPEHVPGPDHVSEEDR